MSGGSVRERTERGLCRERTKFKPVVNVTHSWYIDERGLYAQDDGAQACPDAFPDNRVHSKFGEIQFPDARDSKVHVFLRDYNR